jgi:subtilisin family serine protease
MKKFTHSILILSFLLFSLFAATGNVQSYTPPLSQEGGELETITLPPEALSWSPETEVKTGLSASPKLDSALAELAAQAGLSLQNAADYAQISSLRVMDERVQVRITADPANVQQAIQAVKEAGGSVTAVSDDSSFFQAWLPYNALISVSADKNIQYIGKPAEPVLFEDVQVGTYTTEAIAPMNVAAWHTNGFNGTGVKIAIIDGGFSGYPSLLGSDLPASVTIKNFVDGELDSQVNGTTEHGAACAEIIHDIAPNASLYLVKIGTDLDLQEAVTWVKDVAQVDIISTSLGWYNVSPGDGTGFFANLVQTARSAGIIWMTAAGNDREAHWGGAFNDPDGDDVHNFATDQDVDYFGPGNGDAYLIPAGYVFSVALRWDAWTTVNQDLDLYLLRWNGSQWMTVAYSVNIQNGGAGQTPTEFAAVYTNGSNTFYGFAAVCYSCSRAVNMEIFAPKMARLDKVVNARSLANLADSPAAMTVAALDVVSPFPQESYSSQGPTNGPGGIATGGAIKPDISGFANVSTVSYGTGVKFNGTSSATPHVAGAAALVLSAYPTYTPDQIQNYLTTNAVDMGSAGKDSIFGYGRVRLGTPPASVVLAVTGITPSIRFNDSSAPFTVTGTGFVNGATLRLTRSGQTDIVASNVHFNSSTSLSGTLNLTGAALGAWNVVVTNPSATSAQLTNGLTVRLATDHLYLPLQLK